jgi:hypothetical protein
MRDRVDCTRRTYSPVEPRINGCHVARDCGPTVGDGGIAPAVVVTGTATTGCVVATVVVGAVVVVVGLLMVFVPLVGGVTGFGPV